MWLRYIHPCNLFQAVKITNTYSTRSYVWNRITLHDSSIGYVDLNRDVRHSLSPLAPCQSQSKPESMPELHLSVIFIIAKVVRSCQSALLRAMFIRPGIVRYLVTDLVRDHVIAALARATLVKATLIRATLAKAILVRATLVRATLVRANLLSHITYSLSTKWNIH